MNKLTRKDAINLVGIEWVLRVEDINAEYENMDNDWVYYSAFCEIDEKGTYIEAIYRQDPDELKKAEELDHLNWTVSYYLVDVQ